MNDEVKTLRKWRGFMLFGGERHYGWLPSGAATLSSTKQFKVLVEVVVVKQGPNYFVEYGVIDPLDQFPYLIQGDSWHPNLEEAIYQAKCQFGIDF